MLLLLACDYCWMVNKETVSHGKDLGVSAGILMLLLRVQLKLLYFLPYVLSLDLPFLASQEMPLVRRELITTPSIACLSG